MTKKKRNLKLVLGFGDLLKSDSLGGILLIFFTIVALVWANSPWAESYHHFWELPTKIEVGHWHFEIHLLHLINDVFMAIFFYLVGLEIKREILAGELSSVKKAIMPALGAIGGMLLPAALYVMIMLPQNDPASMRGWGVPMATDIAFSLGILSLLGKRVPLSLKIFLVALAIVDDLGAILVIAIFYTSNLDLNYLMTGLGLILFLVALNRLDVRIIGIYHIVGIFIWYCFYKSGIHATIAGVLLAFTIPIQRRMEIDEFKRRINQMQISENGHTNRTLSHHAIDDLQYIRKQIRELESPVQRLEHLLHEFVNYFIMPIFALANAGVSISSGSEALSFVSVAVIIALFVGKPVGITLMTWIGCKIGIAELPEGIKWKHLFSVAILGGLGFTMSLFIANLAFDAPSFLSQAKIGILVGSIVAGVAGYKILDKLFKKVEIR